MDRNPTRWVAGLGALLLPFASLASNVEVEYAGGVLTLGGDDADNAVAIVDLGVDQVFVVGLSGTTVNGNPVFNPPGPVRGVIADMGPGADRFAIGGEAYSFLTVALGEGDDQFQTLAQLTTRTSGSVSIDTGAGNDVVSVAGGSVGGWLEILGADGGDLDATVTDLFVGGDTRIVGWMEQDSITVRDVEFAGSVQINTFMDDDAVTVSGVDVAGEFAIGVSDGTDAVRVEFLQVALGAEITTGRGPDVAAITEVVGGGALAVRLGDGEDVVSGTRVSVAGELLFDGGDGVDTLTDNGISGDGGTRILRFEVVLP